MFSHSSVWIQPVCCGVVLYWCVVDYLYLWDIVECIVDCNESTDEFDEIADLDVNIPQEIIT